MDELNRQEYNCDGCPQCAPNGECGLASAPAPQEAPAAESYMVVDVHFREGGKEYYFDPGNLRPHIGTAVIVDTARGRDYGTVCSERHPVSSAKLQLPLRKILRLANERDERQRQENQQLEREAFAVCSKKIEELKLEMQLASAECSFDGMKMLFFFTADERVDFRELVKFLASHFHMRIELRQIGVRDKARLVGGLGTCGRPFCCREFLEEFQPVSIKMAKTQNLSLNPTKISGTCGRLMCCLKYEQDAYEDMIKTAPKVESFVDTPGGRGTVTDVNLLRQTVRVQMEKSPDTFVTCKIDEIAVLRNGKARKGDEPIPESVAPISGAPRRTAEKSEELYAEPKFRSRRTAEQPPAAREQSKPTPNEEPSVENGNRRRHRGHRRGAWNAPKEGT